MRSLQYVGLPNPHENIQAFTERVLKKFPGIKTPKQLADYVYNATVHRDAPYKIGNANKVFVLFGADILSNEPLSNPAWQYMPPGIARDVLNEALEQRLARCAIPGLSQTYLFSWHTNWIQQMPEGDYDLIMASPVRARFKDPELVGLHQEVRAYDAPVKERISVDNADDARRVLDERKPRNYVPGGVPSKGVA